MFFTTVGLAADAGCSCQPVPFGIVPGIAVASLLPMAMLGPISRERYHFLVTLLQAISPTTDLVECRPDSAAPSYRVTVRIAQGASTVMYLPAPMVERAHAADPLADYMLRAMLRAGIQEIEGLTATERRRPARPGPPPSAG
jgi:hypothetical protein